MKTIDKPVRYYNISHTQLSIARHYGGIKVNGAEYVYDSARDELVRVDIWETEQKELKRLRIERKKLEALLKAESDEALARLQQKLSL